MKLDFIKFRTLVGNIIKFSISPVGIIVGIIILILTFCMTPYILNAYCDNTMRFHGAQIYSLEKLPLGLNYVYVFHPDDKIYIGYSRFPLGPILYIDYEGNLHSTEDAEVLYDDVDWLDVKRENSD